MRRRRRLRQRSRLGRQQMDGRRQAMQRLLEGASAGQRRQVLLQTRLQMQQMLLALLKNAEMRAEHAIQRKLDAIAGALLEAHADERSQAFEELRNAIRMEEET